MELRKLIMESEAKANGDLRPKLLETLGRIYSDPYQTKPLSEDALDSILSNRIEPNLSAPYELGNNCPFGSVCSKMIDNLFDISVSDKSGFISFLGTVGPFARSLVLSNLYIDDEFLRFSVPIFPNLKELYIIGCDTITYRGIEELKNLKQLLSLCISNCSLDALPGSLGSLKMLRGLDLSLNQLSSLPDSFSQLESLEAINLAENRLTSIPNCLESLLRLQQLIILYNPINYSQQPELVHCLEDRGVEIVFDDA